MRMIISLRRRSGEGGRRRGSTSHSRTEIRRSVAASWHGRLSKTIGYQPARVWAYLARALEESADELDTRGASAPELGVKDHNHFGDVLDYGLSPCEIGDHQSAMLRGSVDGDATLQPPRDSAMP
jgi:hypothetical protein